MSITEKMDPETEAVAALLGKRSTGAAPTVIARLTGLTRRSVNKHLLRLKRAGRAIDAEHGKWVAV